MRGKAMEEGLDNKLKRKTPVESVKRNLKVLDLGGVSSPMRNTIEASTPKKPPRGSFKLLTQATDSTCIGCMAKRRAPKKLPKGCEVKKQNNQKTKKTVPK
jgi:hypothetical protein